MSRSKLSKSSFARLLSLLLIVGILVSGVRVSTIAYAVTQHTWTGNNPPATLNSAGNWLGNVAPLAGDDLFFPAGVKRRSIRNNYPKDTNFNSLNFSGSGYNLRKNSIILSAGINTSNPSGSNQISLPIQLNGSQTFLSANNGTTLNLNGAINLNSNLLSIAGAGQTTVNGVVSGSGGITKNGSGTLTLTGNNAYTGTSTVTAGTLLVNGQQSGSAVSLIGGILGGTGRVGDITATGGSVRPGTSAPGILNSGNVNLSGTMSLVIDLNGSIAGSGYRQLNVSGTVSLGDSLLNASANFVSAEGDTFTIINNDGGDSIVGTFGGLPEGTTITLGGLPFTISYQGGTGNDVVLTRIPSSDPPPPAISISDVSLTEGDGGSTDAIFTLSLSASSDQTITVDYATADDTANTPEDYASVSGTLSFDPGETTKTIAVPVSGDMLNEADETFVLDLRNSTNASIDDAQGQGTILNDDPLPALSIEDVSVTEGNTGTVEAIFSVILSTQSGQTVTVNYATADETATDNPGQDYEGDSGTLTFEPGETDGEVIVQVYGDTDAESDETFFVNLTGQTNSTLADAQGLGTIVDDDTVTPTPTPTPTPDPTPTSSLQFSSASYSIIEDCTAISITVTRIGDTSGEATVNYSTASGTASDRADFNAALGTLLFATGETEKTFFVLITEDTRSEGTETASIVLSNPTGATLGAPSIATLEILDDASEPGGNSIDDPAIFVCQQYHDFLNRQPDAGGQDFWTNEITSCGSNQQCIENKRINVSAAFFLSIEFQEEGFLVYRMYKAAYGDTTSPNVAIPVPIIRLNEFLPDAQRIGHGVQVGIGDWQAKLENNKNDYAREFVSRQRFLDDYPLSLTPAQFVDQLNLNAGNVLSQAERDELIAELNAAADVTQGRASVVRKVAEDADLRQIETNRAFVLMQYYGYLRRNSDDPNDTDFRGWEFWLNKLNQFNGNFVEAEMVKAFLLSIEYRQRFGQ